MFEALGDLLGAIANAFWGKSSSKKGKK